MFCVQEQRRNRMRELPTAVPRDKVLHPPRHHSFLLCCLFKPFLLFHIHCFTFTSTFVCAVGDSFLGMTDIYLLYTPIDVSPFLIQTLLDIWNFCHNEGEFFPDPVSQRSNGACDIFCQNQAFHFFRNSVQSSALFLIPPLFLLLLLLLLLSSPLRVQVASPLLSKQALLRARVLRCVGPVVYCAPKACMMAPLLS